ncbi:hypothetical protein ACI2LF_00240 [Kribbella sp. NPDC020789]
MQWQLWVLIGIVAAILLLLVVTRMRHAQHVFDDLTDLDRPATMLPPDELAHRRVSHEYGRHRKHG